MPSASNASAVSGDGSVIVGQTPTAQGLRGFVWRNGSVEYLGTNALDVSSDGQVICGYTALTGSRVQPWLWRSGHFFNLGVSTDASSFANPRLTLHNSMIVTDSSRVWDRWHGWRNGDDLIYSEWKLNRKFCGGSRLQLLTISPHGSVAAGSLFTGEPWMAPIPKPPVPADLDRDGDVDLDDVKAFASCATGAGLPYATPPGCTIPLDVLGIQPADLDWDGDVDQADFAEFQRCFAGRNRPVPKSCQG